jgi:hypothetical protein
MPLWEYAREVIVAVSWPVEVTTEFEDWYVALADTDREAVNAAVDALEERGPGLGRPLVGEVVGSRHGQLKELRIRTIRVLFRFDPRRSAILLLGGDKRGEWNAWYPTAIATADDLYDAYLADLRDEGLHPREQNQ